MSQFSFGAVPSVGFSRSVFDHSHNVKTSTSVGRLIPVDCQEILPGDTFTAQLKVLARLSSSYIKPVMDTAYLDVYFMYCPSRLLYDDFEQVFGVAKPSSYTQDNFAEVPTFANQSTVSEKSIAQYLGLPIGSIPKGLSVLPFRMYAKAYNEWFRNESTVDEIYVNTGEINATEVMNANAFSPTNYCGLCANVGKKKDYFTACLPAPQKGVPVMLPLGTMAPVKVGDSHEPLLGGSQVDALLWEIAGQTPRAWDDLEGYPIAFGNGVALIDQWGVPAQIANSTSLGVDDSFNAVPNNLWTDLSTATGANINDFRFAVQLQKMMEKDARFGTRYNEYLLGHFGVHSPDARLQLVEYLGGARIPLNVTQVAQTSETGSTPLGGLAGFSLTGGVAKYSKGFTEHGYVMTFACVRQLHTYQQGIEKMWFRKERNDFYDPLFANLGEQPVYQSELYAVGKTDLKDNVFGYNEAWAEYRYRPSRVTGQLNSGYSTNLDIWHFADEYANAPTLSQAFTDESATYFDRTVSVPSTSMDNFILDFDFNIKAYRVMPTYSVPGLVDHH